MSSSKPLPVVLPIVALALVAVYALYSMGTGGQDAAVGDGEPATEARQDSTPPGSGATERPVAEAEPGAIDGGPARARNLLSDDQHSFEGSIQGWTPQGNTTLQRDTGVHVIAGASLAVTVDPGGPWPDDTRTARAGTSQQRDEAVPVAAGASYRAWWQIHADAQVPARCELRWYAAGGQILNTVEGDTVTTTPGAWTEASCGGTAPPNTDYASVRVYVAEADYGMVFHVDDVWLVEEAAAVADHDQAGQAGRPQPAEPESDPQGGDGGAAAGEDRAGGEFELAEGSGDEPRHGEDVGAGNTGPTAYFDEDLGRHLTYDDLERSGSITTTHDGQVIERKDVVGHIVVAHDDVVIRAVRVRNDGSHRYSISYAPESGARGAELSYVEIDGNDDPDNLGVHMTHFTMRHAHVYGQSSGISFGSESTIEYSYVHSQSLKPGSHNAAMSMHGGTGAQVRFNNLVGSTSSALSLYPRVSPLVDIVVEGNLFNAGSYCVYAGGGGKEYAAQSRDIRFVANKFGTAILPKCGQHGPVTNLHGGADIHWRDDNTWQDSGQPVR